MSHMCSFKAHMFIWDGAKKTTKMFKILTAMDINDGETYVFIVGLHLIYSRYIFWFYSAVSCLE